MVYHKANIVMFTFLLMSCRTNSHLALTRFLKHVRPLNEYHKLLCYFRRQVLEGVVFDTT